MMIKLVCAIVGAPDNAFPVDIDTSQLVGDLKDAIKAKNEDIQGPARKLQLFLAKGKDGAWLKDVDPAVQQLYKGTIHPHIQQMIDGEQAMATRSLQSWLFDDNKMMQPSSGQLHVLVVSSGKFIQIARRQTMPLM